MNRQQIIDTTPCVVCGARIGAPCTRKGKPRSTVHGIRVQYATGGRKLTKKKIANLKKRASPHRKPGAGDFYQSWEWKRVRYEALKMHGNRCMCCGWSPMQGNKGRLCVDHIKPRSKFPKLALSLSNLQVLCNSCNMGKSNKHTDDFREGWHGDDEAETFWMDAAFSQTMQ